MSPPRTSSTMGRNMPPLARSVSWVWSKAPAWPKLVLFVGVFCALDGKVCPNSHEQCRALLPKGAIGP